jgi:hypothetical protein
VSDINEPGTTSAEAPAETPAVAPPVEPVYATPPQSTLKTLGWVVVTALLTVGIFLVLQIVLASLGFTGG